MDNELRVKHKIKKNNEQAISSSNNSSFSNNTFNKNEDLNIYKYKCDYSKMMSDTLDQQDLNIRRTNMLLGPKDKSDSPTKKLLPNLMAETGEFTPASSMLSDELPSKSISVIDEKDTDCMNLINIVHGHRLGL
jgi:hypothetical protein